METQPDHPPDSPTETSAADVWGDADGFQSDSPRPQTVLPPKRVNPDTEAAAFSSGPRIGLHIGAGISARETPDAAEPSGQLEVQEIDGQVVRLTPEIPTAAKVPREIKFHEKPAKDGEDPHRRGENSEWGRAHKHSLRWLAGTGAAVVFVIVAAMTLLPLINRSNAARPAQEQTRLQVDPEMNATGAELLNGMLARQPEAEQIFHRFATARIADDFLPLVRDPAELAPLIRATPHSPITAKDWLPAATTTWDVFEIDGKAYGVLAGPLPDFSNFTAYLALDRDHLVLDWKATTGYGSASFAELARGEGAPQEIRAWIQPAQFYTLAFPENEYLCFALDAPDREATVWCYTRRETRIAATLLGLFRSGGILPASHGPQKITVRLAREQTGAFPNQWSVAELLHKDWITP